ncbi:hypothetical protein JKP88DRAFT_349035 [Tribonema minus]|uniref:Uncharacterized protein n=1 Tax=Tribonema minus TaxID=303371 RepID=A0A835YV76_9STRA|nr:hypothetical protein JKP88DRAFT_349035 [Tribonema minus]
MSIQSAILRHDPHADVLVVDEKHPPGNPNAPLRRGGGRAEGGGVAFVQGTVRGLDADAGTVMVAAGDAQQGGDEDIFLLNCADVETVTMAAGDEQQAATACMETTLLLEMVSGWTVTRVPARTYSSTEHACEYDLLKYADVGTVTVAAGDDQQVIGFERCLVATGAPPEPLPDGYVDPAAAGSVLPLHGSEACEAAMWRVRKGGSVVILGSGWEALELACHLRQLSTALVKRLRRLGINVTSHSALRYVSAGREYAPESASGGPQGAPSKGVRVYTCRLHDPLDTCAFNADLLVVARGDKRVERWAEDPQAGLEVGPCGTLTVNQEMMASSNAINAECLDLHRAGEGTYYGVEPELLYATGDAVSAPRRRLGRAAHLRGADFVYAAGDAVSAPHRRLGRAAHLRGADFAHTTGAIAGANMALSAQHSGSGSSGGSGRSVGSGSGSGGSAQGGATWRHESAPLFAGRAPRAGVHVAFVGDCTAAHDTYGYWWSNAALGRAAAAAHDSVRTALEDTEDEDNYSSSAQQQGSNSSSAQQKAALMRATTRAPGGGVAPPIGKGVVFYLSGGRVR